MFRKTAFAITTVAALGAAALVPTEASAKGFKGGWGWGLGVGLAGVAITSAVIADSCYRWVRTPYGWARANLCY
jgi:hypothetical protein